MLRGSMPFFLVKARLIRTLSARISVSGNTLSVTGRNTFLPRQIHLPYYHAAKQQMTAGPGTKFVIRKARPADINQLMALETGSFSCDRLSARRMRHWISAPNGILLVAVPAANPKHVVGYCLAFTRSNSLVARAYSLATSPEARGKGLGRLLMEAMARASKRKGCTAVRLEVAKSNERAIALYEKLNYARYMSLPEYYEDGEDAWRMLKMLK
jgi:ribosomal-protein-alanine N-acetyltransferase